MLKAVSTHAEPGGNAIHLNDVMSTHAQMVSTHAEPSPQYRVRQLQTAVKSTHAPQGQHACQTCLLLFSIFSVVHLIRRQAVPQTLLHALPLHQDPDDDDSLLVDTLVSVPCSSLELNCVWCFVRASIFQQWPHLELNEASATTGTASVFRALIQHPPRR